MKLETNHRISQDKSGSARTGSPIFCQELLEILRGCLEKVFFAEVDVVYLHTCIGLSRVRHTVRIVILGHEDKTPEGNYFSSRLAARNVSTDVKNSTAKNRILAGAAGRGADLERRPA